MFVNTALNRTLRYFISIAKLKTNQSKSNALLSRVKPRDVTISAIKLFAIHTDGHKVK